MGKKHVPNHQPDMFGPELCRSRHFQIISVAMAGWPDAELAARRIFGQLGDPLAATAQLLQVVVAMRK
jgi:hypothetical protein